MNRELNNKLKNIEVTLQLILKEVRTIPNGRLPTYSPSVEEKETEGINESLAAFSNEYITPEDIAKVVLVNPGTVRRWLREGRLKHSRFGRMMRVKTKDFLFFCKERGIG